MTNSELRKYVYVTPRHFRALYFVESDISNKVLTEIIHRNLKVWGGRYNPIIPVRNGKIDQLYLGLLKPLDPDTIFYSDKVDIEEIKKLNFFNPANYEKMDERGSPTSGGVDYHYLLNETNRDFLGYHEKLPILHVQGIYQIDLKAKDFYQTNFALFDLYANQERLIRGFDVIPITKTNQGEINKIIVQRSPYFKSILSQLKINACIFRSKDFAASDRFELIISDPAVSNDDLFYFWNRQQYIEQNKRLYQFIVTKDDFKTLTDDPLFEGLLERFQIHNTIYLVSNTISNNELTKLKDEVQPKFKRIRFDIISHKVFPYEIQDYRYHDELSNQKTKQVFSDNKDLLKLTPPKLTDRMELIGGLVYDVEIEYNVPGQSPESKLKFPKSYPFYKSRVNIFHNQSIFANGTTSVIDFGIPNDFEIFQHRLQCMKGDGDNPIDTPIQYVRYSNAGQRLFALFDLFGNNWSHLMSLINDKFWLDVFRYKSEFKKVQSNIPKGKGIFSHKDLIKEKKLLYEKFRKSIEVKLKKESTEIDIDKAIEWYVKDDIESYINGELQDLIDIGGVFMGLKVKCDICGSNKWYSLKELQDKIPCKGCNRVVIPQIESPYYYRVNEIIINNLLNDLTGDSKDYNGNYVVLRALEYLRSGSRHGFLYCSPLDYAILDNRKRRWAGDVDILALQDGKFIIGEAKNDAQEFTKDEIESLIWLANNVKPDAIMLAHNTGKLSEDKIEKLKNGILASSCEVITYQVSPPWYHHGGLFGLP